jgi:hypothetical protein
MCAKRHVAENDGGFGEIDALAELRRFAQERVELFYRILHAGNLTAPCADVANFQTVGRGS